MKSTQFVKRKPNKNTLAYLRKRKDSYYHNRELNMTSIMANKPKKTKGGHIEITVNRYGKQRYDYIFDRTIKNIKSKDVLYALKKHKEEVKKYIFDALINTEEWQEGKAIVNLEKVIKSVALNKSRSDANYPGTKVLLYDRFIDTAKGKRIVRQYNRDPQLKSFFDYFMEELIVQVSESTTTGFLMLPPGRKYTSVEMEMDFSSDSFEVTTHPDSED